MSFLSKVSHIMEEGIATYPKKTKNIATWPLQYLRIFLRFADYNRLLYSQATQ